MFRRRKQAYAIAREVAPLLRELIPDRTDEERGRLLTLFSAAHDGASLTSLDKSHIDELERTLRYWISARTTKLGELGSPGIGDSCLGCQEFKASMLEMMQPDIRFKRDDEGRLLTPPSLEELRTPSSGELAEYFRKLAAEDNPEISRMVEADSPETNLETRRAELVEEFAAHADEEQGALLEQQFGRMYAALNEQRGDDLRKELRKCWVMVQGRRIARARQVVEEYLLATYAADAPNIEEFETTLNDELDALASGIEEQETPEGPLLPDDIVYRVFTLNEKLTSLAGQHISNRGRQDTDSLLGVLRRTLLEVSRQTPSGQQLPDFKLDALDDS